IEYRAHCTGSNQASRSLGASRNLRLLPNRRAPKRKASACRRTASRLTCPQPATRTEANPSEATQSMQAHPLRPSPGDDLRAALERVLREHAWRAGFVVQGIGSLSVAQLRFAGADIPSEIRGDLEILTLAGSVSPDGAHLHMSIADARGQVFGGHV